MSAINTLDVDSALLDLEGILHALDLVRRGDTFNKPGPELHALSVLVQLAVEKAADLRRAIFPDERESGE